jgi:hypothetical protein
VATVFYSEPGTYFEDGGDWNGRAQTHTQKYSHHYIKIMKKKAHWLV